jgi:alpha-tubulin suppressor-like RCC1 family protein
MRMRAPGSWRPGRTVVISALAAGLTMAGLAGTMTVAPAVPAAASAPASSDLLHPVLSWGSNFYGELGDGSTTDHDTPTFVHLPVQIYTVVRCGLFSLAVSKSGHVYAWGNNSSGQLGNGTTTQENLPVQVKLPAGVKITTVRAGGNFALALSSTGTVYAWGANGVGQLGNGSTTNRHLPVQVRLPKGVKVTSISAGRRSALAITKAGRLLSWGGNASGQLGNGSTRARHKPGYVRLPKHTKVTQIAEGAISSYAVTSVHTLLAWGSNGNGRLGDGTTRQRKTPVRVHLPKGVKVTAVAGGSQHALALTTGHKLLAWGYNFSGELGNNSTRERHKPVYVHLPAGVKITAVVAGKLYSMAMTASQRILTWGYNGNGELGDGSDNSSLVPVYAELPPTFQVTAIGAGPGASTALALGTQQPA